MIIPKVVGNRQGDSAGLKDGKSRSPVSAFESRRRQYRKQGRLFLVKRSHGPAQLDSIGPQGTPIRKGFHVCFGFCRVSKIRKSIDVIRRRSTCRLSHNITTFTPATKDPHSSAVASVRKSAVAAPRPKNAKGSKGEVNVPNSSQVPQPSHDSPPLALRCRTKYTTHPLLI